MTEQIETAYIRERRGRFKQGDGDPLGDYLDEIGKTPLLRAEEEVELAQMIEVGVFAQQLIDAADQVDFTDDERAAMAQEREEIEWIAAEGQRAQERFYLANQRLVVSIAKRYSRQATAGHTLLDMIQEGNIGLHHAIQEFSFTEGNKFSTYATWWIRYEVKKGIREKSRAQRLPKRLYEKVGRIRASEQSLSSTLQREPTIMDIADDLGQPYKQVSHLKALAADDLSLNQNISREGFAVRELSEVISEPERQIDETRTARIREGLCHAIYTSLTFREAEMVELSQGLFGREWAYDELGKRFGLTPEGIESCLKRAFAKVRNDHPDLPDYINELSQNSPEDFI